MEQIKTIPEERLWPLLELAGARAINETTVTCPKCKQQLLKPSDLIEIAEEKIRQWRAENVLDRHPCHCARLAALCNFCETNTYVTIVLLRYRPDGLCPTGKAYAAVFKTAKEQDLFTDALNNILTREATS